MNLNKYREVFFIEARTHINTMNHALIMLEKTPRDNVSLQKVYRAVHTLKSLSTTMGYEHTINLCHVIEDVLESCKHNPNLIVDCTDLLFGSFDHLSETIQALSANSNEPDSSQHINRLKHFLENSERQFSHPEQIRPERCIEKIKTIEVKVERLDTLMNLSEELLASKMRFDLIRETSDYTDLSSTIENLGRLITDLQYHVMQVRLVPVGFVFNRFTRMARDLAKQQRKDVQLHFEGVDIELDRLLADELSESIAHLIRNAIDHGLELPQVRSAAKKNRCGEISLHAKRIRDTVLIQVTDDGAGLDLATIKNIAVKRHLVPENASDQEIKEIVFDGLSTKNFVTSVSGRGLGLPIVKQKIESIGGHVWVESTLGVKTSFFLEIPFTLAIIQVLFVRVGGEIYAIPVESIERLLNTAASDLKNLLHDEAILFDGRDIPVMHLSDLFGIKSVPSIKKSIVVIYKGQDRLGIAVDGLVSTQEVVIKPLSGYIKDNKFFSGAAIIGSQQMVLVIDPNHLLQTKKVLDHTS